MTEVEMHQIDLRFEPFRLKNQERERGILSSIAEQGIREALLCVETSSDSFILLDGFKRLRSAKKLKIFVVPVESLGRDETQGLIQFLRRSQMRGLSFLEEASLMDALKQTYGLGISEIARQIDRSPAWVSVRVGVLAEMSPLVKEAIFSDRFPARAYLYTLRPFTRVKEKKKEVEAFVQSVSGKGLSLRQIERLADSYFRGGALVKGQIQQGNLDWTLEQLKENELMEPKIKSPFNEMENRVLRELGHTQSLLQRVPYSLKDCRLKQATFFIQAGVLVKDILTKIPFFWESLKVFYDQRR